MAARFRGGLLFILLSDFPLPSLGRPSPQGFCAGQGCLGNPGAGLGIRNPGRNIPIRISTPRIGNPADGIRTRNPGRNIPVRIGTPTIRNPASGINFNFGGRDYESSLEITDKKKSHQDEEAGGHFLLIQTKSKEDN